MKCKTYKELLKFAFKIHNRLGDLHGLCYSEKSNNVFDQENDALVDQMECFYHYTLLELESCIEDDYVQLDSWNKELNEVWEMCEQIQKYFDAVTQTPRPDYIYG